jgi:preprotein translocase subunit SecE
MAKSGADRPSAAKDGRKKLNTQTERTTPKSYLREVQGEMKRVAWPPRQEIVNSTIIVIIGVVVMTGLIFGFDWVANTVVTHIFS